MENEILGFEIRTYRGEQYIIARVDEGVYDFCRAPFWQQPGESYPRGHWGNTSSHSEEEAEEAAREEIVDELLNA